MGSIKEELGIRKSEEAKKELRANKKRKEGRSSEQNKKYRMKDIPINISKWCKKTN